MEAQLLADTFNKLSEIIQGQRKWEEVRGVLLQECRVLFDAEVCALFRVNGKQVELEDHIGYTLPDGTEIPELRKHMRYRVGKIGDDATPPEYDGITGQVATTGLEYSLEAQGSRSQNWAGKPDDLGIWSEERPFRCMFAVPLKISDRVTGVLKVENKKREQGSFDEVDKAVLRALGNLFAVASRLSYFRGLPNEELFKTTLEWLDKLDRQNLYQDMMEFCARIFHADVCALWVRNDRKSPPRMELVAGRLSDGDPMFPGELEKHGKDPTYLIGRLPDGSYDGVTGEIATVGEPVKFDSYGEIQRSPGTIGKWDEIVWDGDPASSFLCMMAAPLKVQDRAEPIGILKVERARNPQHARAVFTNQNLDVLTQVASAFAVHVQSILASGTKPTPIREHEYRVTRSRKAEFRHKELGGVAIRHLMTSICQSDLDYFYHDKDPRKLDERLPMPLGHETVGEILHATPDARDANEDRIRVGDRVFVIPLIPCSSCEVCETRKKDVHGRARSVYGENYCPSSRFMASNAPGSLRSLYDYDAGLTVKIPRELESHLAVFAEPMANVVQLLIELGFHDGGFNLNMKPFDKGDFTYFRMPDQQFSNIFNTIIEQEPHPRTLYVLSCSDPPHEPIERSISQQGIMRKGLALLGHRGNVEPSYTRACEDPRILILGTGVSAYLLAVALRHVYQIPAERIVVTGRTPAKLAQFDLLAKYKLNVRDMSEETIRQNLEGGVGPSEKFDIVFEVVGGNQVSPHVGLALDVLKEGGVLAMFGLTDKPIVVDFAKVLNGEIYIKGSYRASLEGYAKALQYITEHSGIRSALDAIIDRDTEVEGTRDTSHDVRSQEHLTRLFEAAARPRKKLGRLIIGRLTQ